jgi:hypothetical protein
MAAEGIDQRMDFLGENPDRSKRKNVIIPSGNS